MMVAINHITQQTGYATDFTQQHKLYQLEEVASLFINDTAIPCEFNIVQSFKDTADQNSNDQNIPPSKGIHSHSKHKYHNLFGEAHIQYHDFGNGDAFTFQDKYTALQQQELQNPYWCLHDPITTKSFQISTDMDIETIPHAIYFSGSHKTVTRINHVPYQTIAYDVKNMFPANLMDDTPLNVFIDNGATPSILPLSTFNNHPVLQSYLKMKSTTLIHTGGGSIESYFWIELPLKLENQIIQIKALVCDSECPYDILLGRTSLA